MAHYGNSRAEIRSEGSDSSSAASIIPLNINPTNKSTEKQRELIATLIEQFKSLTHEFRSFRNSNLAKTMDLKYDTGIDQSQMTTHLETAIDNVTDDETDGSDALQRLRSKASHVTIRPRNDCDEEQGVQAEKAIRIAETLRG